ncbi:MAG: hypothetical protein ABIR91_05905 [Candidatus Saccharimonadales bacterium]
MPTPVTAYGVKLRMLTVKEFENLPNGTVLQCVTTLEVVTKGVNYIDLDTRGGQIAFALQGWDE